MFLLLNQIQDHIRVYEFSLFKSRKVNLYNTSHSKGVESMSFKIKGASMQIMQKSHITKT